MTTAELACPGCGAPLLPGHVDGRRRYTCDGCGGTVIGIAVLRRLLATGVAARLWTADGPEVHARQPDLRPSCPFCGNRMEGRPADQGTIAICRPCEMVWIDKEALASLPLRSVAPPLPLGGTAVRCPQCGAPVGASWDERCRYCGAALKAPTTVVVLPEDRHRAGGGTLLGRAVSGGLALLARALFDWWPW